LVDLIDIRYWYYEADGKEYAPKGGQNLAPRQHARLLKPKKTSFEQVYRAVLEYRKKYPAKAVVYSGDSYDEFGWAVFMAGGSLPVLPKNTNKEFLLSASEMLPVGLPNVSTGQWALGNSKNELIVYSRSHTIQLDLSKTPNQYLVRWIDSKTGSVTNKEEKVAGGKKIEIKKQEEGIILWLTRL